LFNQSIKENGMAEGDNDVKIAVLEEQLRGIREQQRVHADNTEKLFSKLFSEIDILKAALNRGRGIFAASITFAGALGAGTTALLEYMTWGKR
jgi:hypothetical protein